jgi:signal peptidase I
MTSGSMEPAIHQGDYLKIDTNISATDIQVGTKDSDNPGDIIVFYRYNELIVHRAVEKTLDSDGTNSFKTQGDNNGWPDGTPVKESNIVGKVIEIIPASDQ